MRRSLAVILLLGIAGGGAARAAQPLRAAKAMVVSREAHATDAGVRVLQAGGNAVDAAVAVGFALAVTHPAAGNLGGGGFMLIRFADGRTTFVDFRERAPAKASRDMYLGPDGKPTQDSLVGWRAPAVPGTARGLEYASKRYGRTPWARLLAPGIELASRGFPVSWGLARSLRGTEKLARFPESKRIFLKGGAYWQPGELLRQPELGGTLKRIAASGARDFYEGETARRLVAAMQANGGLWTAADLAGYAVIERKPLTGRYRGYEIISAPPPSSGGVGLLEMLGMLEGTGYEKPGAGSAAAIHYVAEVMRRYYADRAAYLADPDFARVPVAGLLDPAYLAGRRQSIQLERATPSTELGPGKPAGDEGLEEPPGKPKRPTLAESAETTHYSIVDAEGNAVAVTYTLNGGYGCGVTPPGVGFLLNNEMDDFAVKPGAPNMYGLVQGERNAIQPGKRPLSSMTPTMVLKDGRLFLVAGSPGGPRIISTVLQVLLNVLDFGMDIQDAVDWPRFHHQWLPDRILLERGFSPDTVALLEKRGHQVERVRALGEVAAILVTEGRLEGAADPRMEGKAAGY